MLQTTESHPSNSQSICTPTFSLAFSLEWDGTPLLSEIECAVLIGLGCVCASLV